MRRSDCLELIYPEIEDRLVVTIMGACAQELYDLGHRENFFYLQHAMGSPRRSDSASRATSRTRKWSYSTETVPRS